MIVDKDAFLEYFENMLEFEKKRRNACLYLFNNNVTDLEEDKEFVKARRLELRYMNNNIKIIKRIIAQLKKGNTKKLDKLTKQLEKALQTTMDYKDELIAKGYSQW